MTGAHALLEWFKSNARPLPWRTVPRDAYNTLVSELMAQQTQLDRVVPRFEAFVLRFPDLAVLAAASEDEVVESWSGLGYYRRARLLHKLAREIAGVCGELPTSAAELEKLPGIGPYTAAAVASVVFGEAVPLMDGNVARVGARVLALADDPRKRAGRAAVLEWVRTLMLDGPPGEVNEALMELGAMVCTPAQPKCALCPLDADCRAHLQGDPTAYPPPRHTRTTVDLHWLMVVIEDPRGRWLLRMVTDGPILRGLWLPPFTEIDATQSVEKRARELPPFKVESPMESFEPIKHSITHRRIEVTPVRVVVNRVPRISDGWRWADPAEPKLPTSSLLAKLLKSVS